MTCAYSPTTGNCSRSALAPSRATSVSTCRLVHGRLGGRRISWPIRRHAFASCTAIGGTLAPMDKQRGIPPDSYAAMLDHFSQEVLDTFYRNMFDEEDQLTRFLATRPKRDLYDLRDEMTAFRDAFLSSGPGRDIYTQKIITSRDRIFSGRNQMRAWGKGNGMVHNWPHFPFFFLTDWRDLLPHSDGALVTDIARSYIDRNTLLSECVIAWSVQQEKKFKPPQNRRLSWAKN